MESVLNASMKNTTRIGRLQLVDLSYKRDNLLKAVINHNRYKQKLVKPDPPEWKMVSECIVLKQSLLENSQTLFLWCVDLGKNGTEMFVVSIFFVPLKRN